MPRLGARLRASCAAALAILCGVSSRVAEPLQYEPSHTRLLAITEEFKFHPGLPGWNFSVPNAGWGMRVRNVQLGAPYEGNPLPGRTLLGVFVWMRIVWSDSSFGRRSGRSGLAGCATVWPGGPLLGTVRPALSCRAILAVRILHSGDARDANDITTKRN